MNGFEIERVFYAGLGATVVCCFFGIIIGLLARLKGYSSLAWFGTGGSILLGAIVLAFQPKVRGGELSEEEVLRSTESGNRVGWILSLIVYSCIMLSLTVWLAAMSYEVVDSERFLQLYFVSALEWSNWPWTVAVCLMLLRFFYLPRSEKSIVTIVAFALVAFQVGWPIAEVLIRQFGLFEDPDSPALRVLNFAISSVTGMSVLFLYFHASEPKRDKVS